MTDVVVRPPWQCGVMAASVESLIDRVTAVGELVDDLVVSVVAAGPVPPSVDARLAVDDRLRELLVGLERVRNAAEAVQSDVMVALEAEARTLDIAEHAGVGLSTRRHQEYIPDEISVLLSCTKVAASRRFGLALQVADLPAVQDAWRAGLIDGRKAEIIADEVGVLRDPDAAGRVAAADAARAVSELATAGAAHAQTHTGSQTRAWLRRRVIAIAPDLVEERRVRAEQSRTVQITPSDDGMSQLWAVLPSVQARQIQQALTMAAHDLGAGDGRTMDQRRADLLVEWLLGPEHGPSVHLHLVADRAVTEQAGCGGPAWLPSVGPLTKRQVDDLLMTAGSVHAHDSSALRPSSEPTYRPSRVLELDVRARDVTCRFPGCVRSALGVGSGTDLDHTVPWPDGPTDPGNLAALCRRHHRLKHAAGWRAELHPDGTMTWTTPSGRTVTTEPWQPTGGG